MIVTWFYLVVQRTAGWKKGNIVVWGNKSRVYFAPERQLHLFMEGAFDYFQLLLPGETVKVDCIAGNTDG